MIYDGRECVIEAIPGGVVNGFYTFAVTITEGGVEIDRYHESTSLQRLRARADANATTVAVERDNAVSEALMRAEDRFKDIVDTEAL